MIITFASSKGGAGKTTCCTAIGTALALQGHRVHIIELDDRGHLQRLAKKLAIPTLTVSPSTPDMLTDTIKGSAAQGMDYILIDVAGLRDTTLIKAASRAHLVIIPLIPGEMELHEVIVVIKDLTDVGETTSRGYIPHAILFTKVNALGSQLQSFVFSEVERLKLPRLQSVLIDRVSYRETFFNGQAPAAREPNKGAGPEIAAVIEEIQAYQPAQTQPAKAAS